MIPSEPAAIITGMIASPSSPSVRFTAFAAPTITSIANGRKNQPRLRSAALNTGKASWPVSSAGCRYIAQPAATSAITNPAASRTRPETPAWVCLRTLA